MAYKQFTINIIIRVAALCATIFLLFYLFENTVLYATTFLVAITVIFQTYLLIKFVSRTNKEIARFFESIKFSDFSQNFNTNLKGASFEELGKSFTEVISKFQNTRAEKEENYRYMQTVLQHIGMGLMTFTPDGNIDLINNAAKKLLHVSSIKNVNELTSLNSRLPEALLKMRAGEKILQKIVENNELIQLSIYATEFRMRGKLFTLVSLQNIQNELEDVEMEAWQKLIRVLTHEIMNSVTPITSLASTANNILNEFENKSTEIQGELKEHLNDVKGAVNIIQKRSSGLLHFVDDYRNLTRIPAPNFEFIKLSGLFYRVEQLFKEQFSEQRINFIISIDPHELEITADIDLIEQVLINLIMNAISFLKDTAEPEIKLIGRIDDRGRAIIKVVDNGPGIPEDLTEKIFIPFFTTKKEGSGIGLSLSRQIMRAHMGSINVRSIPHKETIFILKF